MTAHHTRHELVPRPQYRTFMLRDIDCFLDPAAPAVDDVATATDHVVVVVVAQGLIPVGVEVQVWDESAPAPAVPEWTGPLIFEIACPTGQLVVGDGIGTNLDGIDPPQGPGHYAVEVFHAGRDRGLQAWRKAVAVLDPADATTATEIQRRHSGTEKYLIRLRYSRDLDPDE